MGEHQKPLGEARPLPPVTTALLPVAGGKGGSRAKPPAAGQLSHIFLVELLFLRHLNNIYR